MPESIHTLSIIIVAFNEAEHIPSLKASIDRLDRPVDVDLETVLIDGGSGDGTPEVARQVGFDRVVERPGANIPVCRNEGVRQATGDWVAFIDGDCEVAPEWLIDALPFMNTEEATILGWPASPPDPPTWVQVAWYTHWTHKNVRYESLNGHRVVSHEAFRLITTRNMILHRKAFDRIDGFDEALPTGEDTDFVFRAYNRGIRVLALPTLCVKHHDEPATLRAFFRQQLWHANRSSYRRIVQERGGSAGGHAPAFSIAFLGACALFLLSPVLHALFRSHWAWLLALPLPTLIAGPALLIAFRARRPNQFPSLCTLYIAYGAARSLDLVGFHRAKPSWKVLKREK